MTSFPENIPSIAKAIKESNPKRILDVGSAFGKYSILAREAILSGRAESLDLEPVDDLVIGCVEMAKYFHNIPYHEKLYQMHYHMDVRNIEWNDMPKFDLALMIDVIEHWPKEQGKEIINKMLNHGMKILISTPKEVYMYKEDYYGKDCPKHETQWHAEDFADWVVKPYSTEQSHILIIESFA